MRLRFVTVLAALLALVGADARAQGFVTPQVGGHFGGGTLESRTLTVGGSAGFMAGLIGFEVDYGFAKDFFPESHPSKDLHAVGDLSTLMANVVVGSFGRNEFGGPYVSGGIGTIRILADEPSDLFSPRGNDLGYNLGAGVIGFFNDRIGLRGDVRYFRDIRDDELTAVDGGHHDVDESIVRFGRFGFWRATVGITFRF